MKQPAFSKDVEAALDRYTVPSLPHGFTDRLMARLAAGDLPKDVQIEPVTAPRRRTKGFAGPWVRSGRILGSAALFGLVTAAAAASGFLGDPVYIPVVSDVMARAELVAPINRESEKSAITHKQEPAAKSLAVTPADPKDANATETEPPASKGKEAVKALITQLRNDPDYRSLPRKHRVALARAETLELIRAGVVTRPELRQIVQEMRAEARPVIRQRIEEAAARRQAQLPARPQPDSLPASSAPRRVDKAVLVNPSQPEATTSIAGSNQEIVKAAPTTAEPAINREQVKRLRERYRDATPEQRARIRRAIRERTGEPKSDRPVEEQP